MLMNADKQIHSINHGIPANHGSDSMKGLTS